MRKLTRARKSGTTEQAGILWFLDQRKQARALDPSILWFEVHEEAEKEAWERSREQVLSQWIASRPGSRPRAWWAYDSPRSFDGLPEQRRLISGAGQPGCRECGFGLPLNWLGFSADNPPTFESESMYLKRHNLLTREEEGRCDFSPLTVNDERDLTYRYGRYEIAGVDEKELIGGY